MVELNLTFIYCSHCSACCTTRSICSSEFSKCKFLLWQLGGSHVTSTSFSESWWNTVTAGYKILCEWNEQHSWKEAVNVLLSLDEQFPFPRRFSFHQDKAEFGRFRLEFVLYIFLRWKLWRRIRWFVCWGFHTKN